MGVTRLMLWAPWATSSRKISLSRATVTGLPKPPAEMSWFWQNTHRRLQPEKNTAPLPRVPEITGSSHWCRAARATTGMAGMAQKPPPVVSVRSAPQRRGHRLQIIPC